MDSSTRMRHASTGSEAGFEAPVYRPLIAKSAMNGAQLHLNYCLIEYGYDWATCHRRSFPRPSGRNLRGWLASGFRAEASEYVHKGAAQVYGW
jgi:hypothetical protein